MAIHNRQLGSFNDNRQSSIGNRDRSLAIDKWQSTIDNWDLPSIGILSMVAAGPIIGRNRQRRRREEAKEEAKEKAKISIAKDHDCQLSIVACRLSFLSLTIGNRQSSIGNRDLSLAIDKWQFTIDNWDLRFWVPLQNKFLGDVVKIAFPVYYI